MSLHMDDVFMASKPEKLKNTNENIKDNLNISQSGKGRKFLGVSYEWGCDAKGTYTKMTMEKDVKNLIQVYGRYTGSELNVQKTPGYPEMTLSKIDLE